MQSVLCINRAVARHTALAPNTKSRPRADGLCLTRFVTVGLHQRRHQTYVRVFDKLKELLGKDNTRAIEVEDGPEEEEEGSDMAMIDTNSRQGLGGSSPEAFGPMAILLVGYMEDEYEAVKQLMRDMEADMIKVVPCSNSLLSGTLGEALNVDSAAYETPALGTRRALVLSGMYGSEVVEVISAYKESGLPPCAFAGAVPNNIDRNLAELLQEVHADHQAMMQRVQQRQQQGGYDE